MSYQRYFRMCFDRESNPITYQELLEGEKGNVTLTSELSIQQGSFLGSLVENYGKTAFPGGDIQDLFKTPHSEGLRYLDDASWNAARPFTSRP